MTIAAFQVLSSCMWVTGFFTEQCKYGTFPPLQKVLMDKAGFSLFSLCIKVFCSCILNESIYFFLGYAFEYLIETLNDSSRKKFFNVPRLGGTKYGNVA